jgi:membrane protein
MRAPTATLGRLRAQAREVTARDAIKQLVDAYARNDLLTVASAISFQVLFALIPFALFVLALLGALHLESLWTDHVAPDLQRSSSPAAFSVLDDTVMRVFGSRQGFWITIGAVITVWEVSGAMRGVMGVVDRIYDTERDRGFKERYWTSIWLSVATGGLLLAAFAVFTVSPVFGGMAMSIVRWPLTAALLFAAIYLVVHFAPAERHPADWVSFGSLLVVIAWLGTSLAFAFYVRNVADYGSIFGALATVIIVFEYLYISSIAFLTGLQLDALVRENLEREEERDRAAEGTRLVPAPS